MIFVDSNVLIDVLEDGSTWSSWSQAILGQTAGKPQIVNAVVVAEITRAFADLAAELVFFEQLGIAVAELTPPAAYRAGRAHAAYRAAGGRREAVLADFLIGGHAAALGATLITRDRQRFAAYFPELTLITPEIDHG